MTNQSKPKTLHLLLTLLALGFVGFVATSSSAADSSPKPKYGPMASRLPEDNKFVRTNPAPDYWAMSSYYTAQQ
ncbi:hypothetical protein WDW86_16285 [Bdellovibrionota bacterium FG-2]